jgi:hypothetical protein
VLDRFFLPLPLKIFLPAILSASDGSVKVPVHFNFTFAAGQYNTLTAAAEKNPEKTFCLRQRRDPACRGIEEYF